MQATSGCCRNMAPKQPHRYVNYLPPYTTSLPSHYWLRAPTPLILPLVHRNITEVEMGLIPAVPPVPVKPSLAFGCLKSIPLDKDSALAHLDFLRPHWEWQSTIDYNKKPPRGYLSEGVDIIRGIKEIAAKLKTTPPSYSNEFEFLFDLQLLQNRVRDSHFGSWPLLLDFFIAELGKKFVSISQDGRTAPQIFLHGTGYVNAADGFFSG